MKNESLLAELDGKLKGSLAMDRADTAKGLEILNKMLEVDVHSLMLKKEPHIVDTIKRLRRYVGNIANWKMSANQLNQFNQDAEVIRDIADGIYAKYMVSNRFFSDISLHIYFNFKLHTQLFTGKIEQMSVHPPTSTTVVQIWVTCTSKNNKVCLVQPLISKLLFCFCYRICLELET